MKFKKGNVPHNMRHGMFGTKIYSIWGGIIQRCHNEQCPAYPRYGGRGITVSDEWRTFENFYRDMGERPQGKSLDRSDNDKGYSKENCRWATPKEQARNTRKNLYITHKGQTYLLLEWAEQLGLKSFTLRKRLENGWSIKSALKLKKYQRRKT